MLTDVKSVSEHPWQHTMHPALATPEPMAPRQSAERLADRIKQVEEAREDSSRRLHVEISDLGRRIEALAAAQATNDVRLTRMDSTPLDVEKIRFPPRVVAAIVTAILAIFGGMYAATYGLRSDVRDILTTMESQQRLNEMNQKLSDKQSETLNKAVDAIDKRQQLQQIQIQELKEMVLETRRRP